MFTPHQKSYWTEVEAPSPSTVIVGVGDFKRVRNVEDLLALNYFVKRWIRRCRIGSHSKEKVVMRKRYNVKKVLCSSSSLVYWMERWDKDRLRRKQQPDRDFMGRFVKDFRESFCTRAALMCWKIFCRRQLKVQFTYRYLELQVVNSLKSKERTRLKRAILVFRRSLFMRHLRIRSFRYIFLYWKKCLAVSRLVKGSYRQMTKEALLRWKRRHRWPLVQKYYERTILRYLSRWIYRGTGYNKRSHSLTVSFVMRKRTSVCTSWSKLKNLAQSRRLYRVKDACNLAHFTNWHKKCAINILRSHVHNLLQHKSVENGSYGRMEMFHLFSGMSSLVVLTSRSQRCSLRKRNAERYWNNNSACSAFFALVERTHGRQCRLRANVLSARHRKRYQVRCLLDALIFAGASVRAIRQSLMYKFQRERFRGMRLLRFRTRTKVANREEGVWLHLTAQEQYRSKLLRQWTSRWKMHIHRRGRLRRSLRIFTKLHPVLYCSWVPAAFQAWKVDYLPVQKQLNRSFVAVSRARNIIYLRACFQAWFDLWEDGFERRESLKRVIRHFRRFRLAKFYRRSLWLAAHTAPFISEVQLKYIQRLQQHHQEYSCMQNKILQKSFDTSCRLMRQQSRSERTQQRSIWCSAIGERITAIIVDSSDQKRATLAVFGRTSLWLLLRTQYWALSVLQCRKLLHIQHYFRAWAQEYTPVSRAERRASYAHHSISSQYAAFLAHVTGQAKTLGRASLLRRCIQRWAAPIKHREMALFRVTKHYIRKRIFRYWLGVQRQSYIYRTLPFANGVRACSADTKVRVLVETSDRNRLGPARRAMRSGSSKHSNDQENSNAACKLGRLAPSVVLKSNFNRARRVEARGGYASNHIPSKTVGQHDKRRALIALNVNM